MPLAHAPGHAQVDFGETLGVIGGLDFRLNLFINVLTPLILVSGFSDSMHLVFSIRRSIMAGATRVEAARGAILDVAPGCLLTAMNAAIALSILFLDPEIVVNDRWWASSADAPAAAPALVRSY